MLMNNRALGPKYYNINGIWALKPHYLGPWTLRVQHGSFLSVGVRVLEGLKKRTQLLLDTVCKTGGPPL